MNKQCICFKERMSEYIDNVMNEQEKRKFKEHMNICADCSEELNQMQHIVNILKELPEEDLPENFYKDLMSRIYMSQLPPFIETEACKSLSWLP